MASAGLLHPQVDEDLIAIDEAIRAGQRQLNTNDQPLRNIQIISDVWQQSPPKGRLHAYVRVDTTGEYFIRLFAQPYDLTNSTFMPLHPLTTAQLLFRMLVSTCW